MKVINAMVLLTLLSSLTICPAKRKKLRISKRSRVTMQEEREYGRERSMSREKKTKLCTPDVIRSTTKIGTSLIQAAAMIIAAVLKGVLDK